MARQARLTPLRRFDLLERQARTQRVRRKGHTESKTFIVMGAVTIGMTLPPFFIGLDHDGETPEWKRLTGFAAILQVGTATIAWTYNTSTVATIDVGDITGPPALYDLDGASGRPDPIDLAHGDRIYPYVTDASDDAQGLSAAAFIVTAAR